MKEEDLRFIEQQLARLEVDAPPKSKPIVEEIFASLVRLEKLWTPQEYVYIQHFHQVYGFDEQSNWLRGEIAYDEWMYWHLTAVQRYSMDALDLTRHLASLPTTRPIVWRFETIVGPEKNKKSHGKWKACMAWDNNVPYDVPSMRTRGWEYIALQLPYGVIWKLDAPFPHSIFALTQDDPAVTMLFDSAGSFEKLIYYLGHREAINTKNKVRVIERPIEHPVYVPDAGYSYRWEDGSLIPDGYFARMEARREARRAERQQLEDGEASEEA